MLAHCALPNHPPACPERAPAVPQLPQHTHALSAGCGLCTAPYAAPAETHTLHSCQPRRCIFLALATAPPRPRLHVRVVGGDHDARGAGPAPPARLLHQERVGFARGAVHHLHAPAVRAQPAPRITSLVSAGHCGAGVLLSRLLLCFQIFSVSCPHGWLRALQVLGAHDAMVCS